MTLEALRQEVGSHDFFVILRKWAQQNEYGNVTTVNFIALSERVSGQDLDAFFNAWLLRAGETCAQLVRKLLGDDLRRGTQCSKRVHRGRPGSLRPTRRLA